MADHPLLVGIGDRAGLELLHGRNALLRSGSIFAKKSSPKRMRLMSSENPRSAWRRRYFWNRGQSDVVDMRQFDGNRAEKEM